MLTWLRKRSAWIAIPIVAPIAVFWSAIFGAQGMAPADGFRYYLPLRVVAARIWRSGHLPVWNPFEYSGYPLLASAQTAVLYPPNALFVLFPTVRTFNVVTVLQFVIAGVGAFLLGRRLTGDNVAATVAGVAFGLSGFMFAHIGHHAIIASAAWLPWCFLGYELVVERMGPGALLLGASAVALTLLAGHPQTWFVLLAALVGYAVVRAALEHSRPSLRLLVAVGLVIGLGAGLGAMQLLPTASIVGESDRSEVDFETAVSFSLTPSDLPLLVFPMAYGGYIGGVFDTAYQGDWNFSELAGYPTAAALALAAAGLLAARRDKRVVAIGVVGLVALLIALGGTTPLGRIVYGISPYGQFRAWGRYLVFFDLAVAVLAAYGVAELRAASLVQRRRAIVAAAAAALGIVVLALLLPHLGAVQDHLTSGRHRMWALLWPSVAAVGTAGSALLLIRRPRAAVAGLALFVVADALFMGWHTEWRGTPSIDDLEGQMAADVTPSYGTIPDQPGGVDRYLYLGNRVHEVPEFVSTTDPKDMYAASGYDPLAPKTYLDAVAGMTTYGGALDAAGAWNPGSDVLDLLRVSLVLTSTAEAQPDPSSSLLRRGRRVAGAPLTRYEYRPRLPEAFLVGQVVEVPTAQVARTLRGDVEFDPVDEAFVEDECRPCVGLDGPGPSGSATIERRDAGSLTVTVNAQRRSMLVVSQAWFPGWKATVDGRSAEVYRVDGVVNGVVVGAGAHRVELFYRAPGLRLGALVSLVTLLGLVGWAVTIRVLDAPWRNARHAGGRASLQAQCPPRPVQSEAPVPYRAK